MNYKSLLKKLDKQVSSNLTVRRYNLSDMISESYKALYACESGTNLHNLVESHIEDIRKNPSDIERLSRQLSVVKQVIRMTESGDINDKDLVAATDSEYEGDVEKEVEDEREKRLASTEEKVEESKDDEDVEEKDDEDLLDESVHDEDVSEEDDEDLLEDTELTDEEVEELTKHLAEIRKNKKKMTEADDKQKASGDDTEDTPDEELEDYFAKKKEREENKEVKESKGRKLKKRVNEEAGSVNYKVYQLIMDVAFPAEKSPESYGLYFVGSNFKLISALAKTLNEFGLEMAGDMIEADRDITDIYANNDYEFFTDSKEVSECDTKEKTYESLDLSDFGKKSSGKAFMKTFKKLEGKLQEGTALTRQESISLYKAANSALTHLSVELEHNPEFLETFSESVTLLSGDVNKLLESTKNGKAPSKATMKSLAKFADSLLKESEEDKMTSDEMRDYWEKNKNNDPVLSQYKSYEDWYKDSKENGYVKDEELHEDEDNDLEISVEDEEFVGADEGDLASEDEEEFDQEYADARVELHKEMVDKYGEDEDPAVQEKLSQDAEEVVNLPGITDEQVAEIEGEESTEEESPEEADDSEDITDDELAELKKHLKEMRKAKEK